MVEEIVTSSTGGQKGKKIRRIDLIPAEPLGMVGDAYGHGASKYAERNWERGYDWSLALAALHRHLNQWHQGEVYDEETNIHHLASVVFHALSLMEFETTHPEYDDVHQDAPEPPPVPDWRRLIEEVLRDAQQTTPYQPPFQNWPPSPPLMPTWQTAPTPYPNWEIWCSND